MVHRPAERTGAPHHPDAPPLPIGAEVAQLVEQWTENPCVGGSSPPLGTIIIVQVVIFGEPL